MSKKQNLWFGFIFFCAVLANLILINSKDKKTIQNIETNVNSQKVTTTNSVKIQNIVPSADNKLNQDTSDTDPNQRAQIALQRFDTELAKIPHEAVTQELSALKNKTAQLEKIKAPMPIITQEIDEDGTQWRKLTYPTGDIRYELVQ